MFENTLPAPLNLSIVAGKESVYEVEIQTMDGTPEEVRYYTYSGRAESAKGAIAEIEAHAQEERTGRILVTIPALSEGEYKYSVDATSDSGDKWAIMAGTIGAYWPELGKPKESDVRYPNRQAVIRMPGLGKAGIAAWQKLAGIDEAVKQAQDIAASAEETAQTLEQYKDVLAVLDGTMQDILTFDPETGTIWIGDYNTGAQYKGEPGKDGKDGKDGEDGYPALISSTGTWLVWSRNLKAYEDTGMPAIGRDGVDGTAVKRIIVPSVSDIPQSGETCNGGYYYYVPLPAETAGWATGAYSIDTSQNGAQLFINGERIAIAANATAQAASDAIREHSQYVTSGTTTDGLIRLTAKEPGEAWNGLELRVITGTASEWSAGEGTSNMLFNYLQVNAGQIPAGTYGKIAMNGRSTGEAAMTTEPRWLGVWEIGDDGATYQKAGVSTNAQEQAAGKTCAWIFDGLELHGRETRMTLLDAPDAYWQQSSVFGTTAASTDKGRVRYNNNWNNYLPGMTMYMAGEELAPLAGGRDAKPRRYDVYGWLRQGERESWTRIGEANDLATAEIDGLVKLGTNVIINEGAVIGNNADGQMTVPRATLNDYGAVKPGSYIRQVNERPYQQAVGMLDNGQMANNLLYNGALKHQTVAQWKNAGMEWLQAETEEHPGLYHDDDYNTGLETSGQFSQSGNTLSLLEATTSRLAGVHIATGISDGRATAVMTPTMVNSHLATYYYTKGTIDEKLKLYVKLETLQEDYCTYETVYTKEETENLLTETLQGYATKESLQSAIQLALAGYAKKSEAVLSDEIRRSVIITKSEFDALAVKDARTEYKVIAG